MTIHRTALIGEPPEARGIDQFVIFLPKFHAPIIDPTASIGAYVTIDSGIDHPTKINARSFLMKHVHIGHDAWIGENCELAPGVVICGYAIIENHVKIGVNACVLPYVCIGERSTIGAGAVVTKNVPPGKIFVGNPAKELLKHSGRLKCGCFPNQISPTCRHHSLHVRPSPSTSS